MATTELGHVGAIVGFEPVDRPDIGTHQLRPLVGIRKGADLVVKVRLLLQEV